MDEKRIAILDVEANNLMPFATQIWVVCAKMVGEKEVYAFRDKDELAAWIDENNPDAIVGHNILGFDKAVLSKCWGIDLSEEIVDTLLLSQFLNPDRPEGHSLAAWGDRLGFAKGDHNDFSQYSAEMENYCKRDVMLTERVLNTLLYEVNGYYSDTFFDEGFWKAATKNYWLMNQQANTGIGFDKEKATSLLERIDGMMKGIEQDVEPQLPQRPLNKGELDFYRIPARPFKKDGSFSSVFERWLEKVGAALVEASDGVFVDVAGSLFKVEGGSTTVSTGPMTLSNQSDLKDWLVELGWEPTLWNFKRDPRGKPMRDDRGQIVLTTPKLQENGKICPNLEELQGDLVGKVVKWLSLRNRRSVVEGWLENERLAFDGRLSAGASGFASTFRQRHTVVVNVPKAQDDILLGKEMRELFCSDNGMVMVGWDGVALESRVEAHYCMRYKGGKEHAENILDGDQHTKNAFVFYPEDLAKEGFVYDQDGLKDNSRFKYYRQPSKNARYALSYGCSPAKLAKTLRQPESKGEELYEAFWNANPALKALRERLTKFWETTGERKWITGIDGRKVVTRSKHSLVNTLFQSCGAIVMDYSALFMDKWLGGMGVDNDGRPCYTWKGHKVYRVGYWHDEYIWVTHESVARELGELGVKSIERAGEFLKLNVPLAGEAKVGYNWSMIH